MMLPISALSDMMDGGPGRHREVEDTRAIFRSGQIEATIAMLDTEGAGVAIIAQTKTGMLMRINLPKQSECLDLARTLLAKVVVA